MSQSPSKQTNTRSKWYQLMYQEGGYIAHNGVLVPIDLASLALHNDDNDNDRDGTYLHDTSGDPREKENYNDDWYQLHPVSLETTPDDNKEKEKENLEYPMIDQLLFVNKPTSLLTLPGIGPEKADCLASRVKNWLDTSDEGMEVMKISNSTVVSEPNNNGKRKKRKQKKKKKNPFEQRPCHRLDYDTSGVICISLSPDSHRATSKLFELRLTHKTYVALVSGHVEKDFGIIDYPIGKVPNEEGFNEFACLAGERGRKKMIQGKERYVVESDFIENSIRSAETEYQVSQRFTVPVKDCDGNDSSAKYTRVSLKPLTGRGHQLRLHMEALGNPILGDQLHSPPFVSRCTPRLCLHAETLMFQAKDKMEEEARQIIVQAPAPF